MKCLKNYLKLSYTVFILNQAPVHLIKPSFRYEAILKEFISQN